MTLLAHILPCHIEASILLWIFSSAGVLWAALKTITTRFTKTKPTNNETNDANSDR